MQMKKFLWLIVAAALQTASMAAAQTSPTIEIVLSEPVAQQGDILTAEVWVYDAVHVGGADIGITVDEGCLRIVDRQEGGFLPTTEAEGAFSALSEVNVHDTRLATALADRSKHVSGDGIFYQVQLETTCPQGLAALNVARAQVSSYVDPQAEIIDLVNYELDKNTLHVVNAQLRVEAAAAADQAPASDEAAAPVEQVAEPQSNTLTMIVVGLTAGGVILLGFAFWIVRRNRREEEA